MKSKPVSSTNGGMVAKATKSMGTTSTTMMSKKGMGKGKKMGDCPSIQVIG